MIAIETSRLLLRNYRAADFEDIIKYFSDEEVSKFEDFYPMSEKQVRNMITEWKDMDNRHGDCDVRNVSSWKLLERLGFQRIRRLDNQSYKNGNPILIGTFLYELDKAGEFCSSKGK